MDGFEINKILGAVLGTCLFVLSVNIVAGGVFAPRMPATPGYEIAVPDEPTAPVKVAVEPDEPISVRLAKADIERGATAARKCVACHTFEQGEANKVGPNLWGTVGGPRAHHEQFSYSSALQQMGGTWDFESLDRFLANPRAEVKGTSMAFAGIPRASERADIIAYMNTLSDKPLPLPEPEAAPQKEKEEEPEKNGEPAQQ